MLIYESIFDVNVNMMKDMFKINIKQFLRQGLVDVTSFYEEGYTERK